MLKLELKPRNGKRTFEAVGCQKDGREGCYLTCRSEGILETCVLEGTNRPWGQQGYFILGQNVAALYGMAPDIERFARNEA